METLNKKSVLYISIALLVLTGLVVFVVIPMQYSINDLNDQLNEKRLDLAMAQQQSTHSSQQENEPELQPMNDKLDDYFVSKNQFLEFVSSLENIAQENNIGINITINEFSDTDPLFDHPLSLSLTGSYNNLINYIIDLESMDYYFNYNTINISSAISLKEESMFKHAQSSTIKADITGTTYWRQ
ncbi:type 4a pilus biogenesis protein PilO [Patescibacteria group bacterium]|nr:type 4a pilus biogenesis protein PilO [Patescibacteria group bacterium]MBU1890109.1 type 4a pilus biogenesis protein PilO [Patescibacteria group bacterium]